MQGNSSYNKGHKKNYTKITTINVKKKGNNFRLQKQNLHPKEKKVIPLVIYHIEYFKITPTFVAMAITRKVPARVTLKRGFPLNFGQKENIKKKN